MSNSESSHAERSFLISVGDLVAERAQAQPARVPISDLDNPLLRRLFNAGWEAGRRFEQATRAGIITADPTDLPTISGQQTCKVCGRPDKFDFHVPDAVWTEIVPEQFRKRVVCLYCFDDFALWRRASYASAITELYFAGRAATFVFNVDRRVDHPRLDQRR